MVTASFLFIFIAYANYTFSFIEKEELIMSNYSYEDVKKAYVAIIKVGKANATGLFGGLSAQLQHNKNLKELDDSAKELYEKLLNDNEINY